MTINDMTVSEVELYKAGKSGEGGIFMITNSEFLAAVFPRLPEGAFVAVCSKSGDPAVGGWMASRADSAIDNVSYVHNNFVGCSSFIQAQMAHSRHARLSLQLAIF